MISTVHYYYSGGKITKDEVERACVTEMRNKYTVFVGKYEVKRPLGRPRHQWRITSNQI